MRHTDFNLAEHGFVGHLAEQETGSDRAVIVVMGGEQSLLPGIKFAKRFADFGITGLAVSLFGAEGLPDSPNRIPLELIEAAMRFLREEKKIPHLSIYGQSMGSIFAALAAEKLGGFENMILVSPTHTLIRYHKHVHQHSFTHTHDSSTHTHTVAHSHEHNHYVTDGKHGHRHTKEELERLVGAVHS